MKRKQLNCEHLDHKRRWMKVTFFESSGKKYVTFHCCTWKSDVKDANAEYIKTDLLSFMMRWQAVFLLPGLGFACSVMAIERSSRINKSVQLAMCVTHPGGSRDK